MILVKMLMMSLHSFNRWPTWMWANKEMVELVEWLKQYNLNNNKQKKDWFLWS